MTGCGSLCQSCIYSKEKGVSCSICDETAFKETSTSGTTCASCTTSENGYGCKKCVNSNTCTRCKSTDYMLVNKKCLPCSDIHSACTACHDNYCNECSLRYYKKFGSCSMCPRNCDRCFETNGVVKCSKCKAFYINVDVKRCDRCPDNCRQCKVLANALVCETCNDKYAKNSNGLCSECPRNCNLCTWSRENSRTECSGSDTSHSCFENINGKSWGKKQDGTCVGMYCFIYPNLVYQFNFPLQTLQQLVQVIV